MSKTTSNDNESVFPDKLLKRLPDGWADTANGMKDDELKKAIFEAEANIYNIEKEKENDAKLNGAKDLVKDLSVPYREAKACQATKIKYALFLLEGRGINLGS